MVETILSKYNDNDAIKKRLHQEVLKEKSMLARDIGLNNLLKLGIGEPKKEANDGKNSRYEDASFKRDLT